MSEPGTRPGGLTALAVANFVFAAVWMIGAVLSLAEPAMVGFAESAALEQEEAASRAETRGERRPGTHRMSEEDRALFEEHVKVYKSTPYYLFILVAAVRGAVGLLLFLSGIGYIKLKPFLGRFVGTVAAMLMLLYAVAQIAYLGGRMPEGFDPRSLIGVVYAALTLFSLHVIFKHDFGT